MICDVLLMICDVLLFFCVMSSSRHRGPMSLRGSVSLRGTKQSFLISFQLNYHDV